jgi:ribosomal protein L16 Arg81 hydroxylase
LIRQAFPEFESPISAEELAGLACEPDIESRLIEEHGHRNRSAIALAIAVTRKKLKLFYS